MIRTQISLTKADRKSVDQLAGWHGVSLSEIIRRSIREYSQKQHQRQTEKGSMIAKLAGSLKNSPTWKNIDTSAYQRKLRREKGI
jgi:metal-responsive CopG/Arc/MetJ family transcriptional regulator